MPEKFIVCLIRVNLCSTTICLCAAKLCVCAVSEICVRAHTRTAWRKHCPRNLNFWLRPCQYHAILSLLVKVFQYHTLLVRDFYTSRSIGEGKRISLAHPFVPLITVYVSSCLGQEKANGPCGLRVKLPLVYHTW